MSQPTRANPAAESISDLGSALRAKKKRLGEELIAQGLITNDQVSIALKEQKKPPSHWVKHWSHLAF